VRLAETDDAFAGQETVVDRDVSGRRHAGAAGFFQDASQTEIRDAGHPFAALTVRQNVLRFQVAVQQSLLMGTVQRHSAW
jgi:hypothetical protein